MEGIIKNRLHKI